MDKVIEQLEELYTDLTAYADQIESGHEIYQDIRTDIYNKTKKLVDSSKDYLNGSVNAELENLESATVPDDEERQEYENASFNLFFVAASSFLVAFFGHLGKESAKSILKFSTTEEKYKNLFKRFRRSDSGESRNIATNV